MKIYMQMKDLALEGNLIDNGWIENLRYENGKTNLNAVMILSEIVYWYRPTEIRNELTGQVEGYRKKFKADKLQKNYQALGDRFGLTKRQAKDACDFLKGKGIISVEFRTIKTESGKLPNVMFIEPIIENLKAITGINRESGKQTQDTHLYNVEHTTLGSNTAPVETKGTPPSTTVSATFEHTSYLGIEEDVINLNTTPPTIACKTNTYTTTDNTTNNITDTTEDINPVSQYEINPSQELSKIFSHIRLQTYEADIKKLLKHSLEDMYLTNTFSNKLNLPLEKVRERLTGLDINMIDRAIFKYTIRLNENSDSVIKKPGPYFCKCLWSALTEQSLDNLYEDCINA
jgi:hypothetical protein